MRFKIELTVESPADFITNVGVPPADYLRDLMLDEAEYWNGVTLTEVLVKPLDGSSPISEV